MLRYEQFTVRNYRAISGPLVIDLSRRSLFPIIGINEAGKTTVLHALFAFDYYNDALNGGRHLEDTSNLYRTSPGIPTVTATVLCDKEALNEALEDSEEDLPMKKATLASLRRKHKLPSSLTITRDLRSKSYSIAEAPFQDNKLADALARNLLAKLPYILYFDDFRDKVDQRIAIPAAKPFLLGGWSSILEQLFKKTDKSLSILQLAGMEERQRKSALAKVQRRLNETLTKEWQHFRLDDSKALEIGIEFEPADGDGNLGHIKLEVVERDANGDNHYFFISDRSKGFYWFFNFVMKLEFNPKVIEDSEGGSIYLLDEPGSYLHATAQTKLCAKLKALSESNTVIYCTHSHYLLNPDVIPLSAILVADKDENGSVSLVPIHQHEGNIVDRRSAFQPVIDALQIKPFVLDLTHSLTIIVEGIYDYYALELFRQQRPVSVLPSVGAPSVKFYISLLIAWQVRFRALWDNDAAGRRARQEATTVFGEELSDEAFRVLPSNNDGNRILQNLFDGDDISMLRRELQLDANASFEKTIATWFFSPRRGELLNAISAATHKQFAALWESLTTGL